MKATPMGINGMDWTSRYCSLVSGMVLLAAYEMKNPVMRSLDRDRHNWG
jgi:hypothetical protein